MNRGPGSFSGDCSFPVWVAGEWAERCFKRSCEAFISRQFTVVTSSFLSKLCGQQLASRRSELFLHGVALLALGISRITIHKARDGTLRWNSWSRGKAWHTVQLKGAKPRQQLSIVLALLHVSSHSIQTPGIFYRYCV